MNDEMSDLQLERALNSALAALAKEAAPAKDCWPEIKQAISVNHNQPAPKLPAWVRWSLAASVLLTVASFSMNWWLWQDKGNTRMTSLQPEPSQLVLIEQQVEAMEQQYSLAKSLFLHQLAQAKSGVSQQTLEVIESNLIIIEQATEELKIVMKQQPVSSRMTMMLKDLHQKELDMLSDFSKRIASH